MSIKCRICKQKTAQYTCPKCNLAYCSMDCFRSPDHGSCSEDFYKQTIKQHIDEYQTNDPEEKKAMLDILRRISDGEGLEDAQEGDEDDSEAQGAELAKILEGVDLDSIDTSTLEMLLSPSQLAEMKALLADESKARQLLEQVEPALPWWSTSDEEGQSTAKLPEPLFSELIPAWDASRDASKLIFNASAILMAYAITFRTLDGLDDSDGAVSVLQRILPFLFDNSTVALQSIEDATQYIFSRSSPMEVEAERTFLQDTQILLQRPLISSSDEQTSTPAFRALGDLHAVLSNSRQKGCKAASRKIAFYAAILNANAFTTADLNKAAKQSSQALSRLDSASETTSRDQILVEESATPKNEALLPALNSCKEQQQTRIQILS